MIAGAELKEASLSWLTPTKTVLNVEVRRRSCYRDFHTSNIVTWSTTLDEVEWRDCCSLHAVGSSVIYCSTNTRENVICLFYAIQRVY